MTTAIHDVQPESGYYLPEGTPCQWCGSPLRTMSERNASICHRCFTDLDARHQAREARIQAAAEAAQSERVTTAD